MHADPAEVPVEIRPRAALKEAEAIAVAYHRAAQGDAWAALVAAITDALIDLDAAERRIARQDRLISRGYARGWTGAGAGTPGPARSGTASSDVSAGREARIEAPSPAEDNGCAHLPGRGA